MVASIAGQQPPGWGEKVPTRLAVRANSEGAMVAAAQAYVMMMSIPSVAVIQMTG